MFNLAARSFSLIGARHSEGTKLLAWIRRTYQRGMTQPQLEVVEYNGALRENAAGFAAIKMVSSASDQGIDGEATSSTTDHIASANLLRSTGCKDASSLLSMDEDMSPLDPSSAKALGRLALPTFSSKDSFPGNVVQQNVPNGEVAIASPCTTSSNVLSSLDLSSPVAGPAIVLPVFAPKHPMP